MRNTTRLRKALMAAMVAVTVAECAAIALLVAATQGPVEPRDDDLTVQDEPYEWVFDYSQDLQMTQLPTGCEATALSTLLRMSGVTVTKYESADAMPKGDGSDFVNEFWGDPYSETGWACMAPCVVATADKLTEGYQGIEAVDLTGTDFEDLPMPSCVWVTIGMEDAVPSPYEQDGYRLMYNPHCIVVTGVEGETVNVVDPLVGVVEYPLETVEETYEAMGKQAVAVWKE